jgi:hypothetical protein
MGVRSMCSFSSGCRTCCDHLAFICVFYRDDDFNHIGFFGLGALSHDQRNTRRRNQLDIVPIFITDNTLEVLMHPPTLLSTLTTPEHIQMPLTRWKDYFLLHYDTNLQQPITQLFTNAKTKQTSSLVMILQLSNI